MIPRFLIAAAVAALVASPVLAQSPQSSGGPLGNEARKMKVTPKPTSKKVVKRSRSGQAAGGPAGESISSTAGAPKMAPAPGPKSSPQSSGGVKQ